MALNHAPTLLFRLCVAVAAAQVSLRNSSENWHSSHAVADTGARGDSPQVGGGNCSKDADCHIPQGHCLKSFQCSCAHYYTGNHCDELPPLNIPNRTANIHIVMHTHDDLGWDWTLQEYYTGTEGPGKGRCVRKILTDGIQQLLEDPLRRFSYVEIGFFELWWREQNDTMKEQVKALVATGQLEFVSAGWCMNDEATVHYSDAIDQMTLGHLWLHANFGTNVIPDVGWQIDPFGHSTTQAMLFAKMGFNMLHFTRAPEGTPREPQFVWRPSNNIQGLDLWTFWYPNYGYFLECQENCLEGDFVNWANFIHTRMTYKTPHLMLLYGGDFADPNFPEADQLVKGLPQDRYKLNVTYSTPSQFYKSVMAYNEGKPDNGPWDMFVPPNDDFFPYWTGFFTSQSEFKGLVRRASAFLHGAWALHTVARHRDWSRQGEALNVLWAALGIAQHHDAVTGTATRVVYADYTRRLLHGIAEVSQAVLEPIIGDSIGGRPVHACPPGRRPTMCSGTVEMLQRGGFMVSVTNPIAWPRDEIVELEVLPGSYLVSDSRGATLLSQTTALQNGNVTLIWMAKSLAPLGTAFFTVIPTATGTSGASVMASATEVPQEGAELENEKLLVSFDASGRLRGVTAKEAGQMLRLNADVLFYRGSTQENGDDAYDFLADGDDARRFEPTARPATIVTGPLRKEVCVEISNRSHIMLCVGLVSGAPYLTVDVGLGPVDVSDNVGKNIILRVNSTINSSGVFYTDSQGLELMRRTRGRGTWNQTLGATPGRNYYPATSMSAIRDAGAQLVMLTDRAEGTSSMVDGTLEMMIYRRIFSCSDIKGLSDNGALNRNSTINTTHWLLLGTPGEASALMRQLAVRMYNPLIIALTPGTEAAAMPRSVSQPLARALPENLHLLNLQTLHNNFTVSCGPGCDITSPHPGGNPAPPPVNPSALKTGSVILRLAHIYASGEGGSELSQPASIDLQDLFSTMHISRVTEYSLSVLQEFSSMQRARWPTAEGTEGSFAQRSALNGSRVTIGPMDIRTFVVQLTSVGNETVWI